MQSLLSPKLELASVTLLSIFFSYQSVAQSTSVVTNNLNTGPGSFRNAIAEANADALSTPDKPHQITFDPAIGNTITINSPFLVVTNHVNIAGPGKSKLVISGGNTTRIFWLQNGNITISGLTLAKGYARGGNGGYAGGGGMGAGGAIFMHEGRQDPQSANGIISGSLIVRIKNIDFKNNLAFGGVGGFGWGHVNFEEEGGFYPLVGGGGGMGGNGGGEGEGMPGAGGGGGIIGNGGSDFGGSVTGANDFQPGTNGAITIFGSGGGANIPGFGGGGGYSSLAQTRDGNFGGGGSGGGGGGFGGGGGSGRDGGFGGGGGGGWTAGGFGGSYGKGLRQETEKGWDSGEGGDGMGAGGAIFVASGRLLLSQVGFISNSATAYSRWDDNVDGSYSLGLGGAIFIFNKQDNHGLPAPGTTNDPMVTSCGRLFFQNNTSLSDANQPGINDDNQYGTISADSTEFVQIVNEPEGQTVDAGGTVTASITTEGSVVSYQWYKDGVSLGSSQQTAKLTLYNVTPADAGRYRVVVKGYCNSLDCSRFVLKVNSCTNGLKLLVRPNPSNSYFTIIATSDKLNEKVVLKITNETGRAVEVKNTTVSKSLQIGASYPPGLYMVQGIQGDKTATLKLIKR